MCIYLYIYVCVYMYVCVYVSIIYVCIYMHMCMYVYIYVFVYGILYYVGMCVCMCVYMCVFPSFRIRAHSHVTLAAPLESVKWSRFALRDIVLAWLQRAVSSLGVTVLGVSALVTSSLKLNILYKRFVVTILDRVSHVESSWYNVGDLPLQWLVVVVRAVLCKSLIVSTHHLSPGLSELP